MFSLRPAAAARRAFSTSSPVASMIGKTPVVLPPDLKLTEIPSPPTKSRYQLPRQLEITGPLGSMYLPLPDYLTLNYIGNKVNLVVADPEDSTQRAMWGTTRALLAGHILGVTEGHTAILRLVGVGYRALMEQEGRVVSLKVGYSHPVELKVPEGVKASVPQPTRILIEGRDRRAVKQFAANIRDWRKPEPYKGKGIFVDNETIKLKAKKVK